MDGLNPQAPASPPRKSILLFSDGTGNSSSKLQKTNVWRLYEALDLGYPVSKAAMKAIIARKGENAPDAHSDVQVAYYDNGVGTSAFKLLAVLGGIFGFGLARNIRDLYKFLCRNYRPGDRIYAFGFSRGAYTIRLLVSLIVTMGVVKYDGITESELDLRARDMWRGYRRCFRTNNPGTDLLVSFGRELWLALIWAKRRVLCQRRDFPRHPRCGGNWLGEWWRFWFVKQAREGETSGHDGAADRHFVEIEFVGVWDTVAAYGGPLVEITRAIDEWIWPLSMPNYELSRRVKTARHALAIDDKRDAFLPLLWDETYESEEDRKSPQPRLQQVWFAGMHSDVGGGYSDESLSYVSLYWMVEHAEQAGVRLLPEFRERIETFRNVYGPIHNSRGGGGAFYRYQPRYISAWLDYAPKREFRDKHSGKSVKAHVRPGTQIFRDPTIDRKRYRERGFLQSPIRLHKSVEERLQFATDGYGPNNLPPRYIVDDGIRGTAAPAREAYHDDASEAALSDRMLALGDRIKMRRFWYFASFWMVVLIALKPAWPSIGALRWLVGTVDARTNANLIENTANAFLPDFANSWTSAIATDPYMSTVLFLLLFLFTALGLGQEMKMTDIARLMWQGRFAGAIAPLAKPGPLLRIARFVHSSDWLQGVLAFFKWRLTPLLLGLVLWLSILYAVLALATQLWLVRAEPRPGACAPAGDREQYSIVPVDISSPCTDLGYSVEPNKTYRIEVAMADASGKPVEWRDATQPANPDGWSSRDWQSRGFAASTKFYRRVIGAPLFAPLLQIRNRAEPGSLRQAVFGDDIYMIAPRLERSSVPGQENIWQGTFRTPENGGRIHFFLNDAVVPFDQARPDCPVVWDMGISLLGLCGRYANNQHQPWPAAQKAPDEMAPVSGAGNARVHIWIENDHPGR